MAERIKDGTVRQGKDIDWTGDIFKRSNDVDGDKFFIRFGMWKGPFDTAEFAKEAYAEWAFEARFS